jgi:micrococcal nuclease
MKRVAVLLLFAFFCVPAQARPSGWPVEVTRVIDGDSWVLDIELGLDVHVRRTGRALCIDTPEVYGATREAGLKARAFAVQWIGEHCPCIAEPGPDPQDKYGRVLIVLHDADTDAQLNRALLDAGHAVPYLCPNNVYLFGASP